MYVKRHIFELKIKALEIVSVLYVTWAVAKKKIIKLDFLHEVAGGRATVKPTDIAEAVRIQSDSARILAQSPILSYYLHFIFQSIFHTEKSSFHSVNNNNLSLHV